MKTLTILTLALCCSLVSFSQTKTAKGTKKSVVMVMNQNSIDKTRYDGIDKDPYLFQEFAKATAYKKNQPSDDYVLNFNGNSREFEFVHNGVTAEMDASYYDVIKVEKYTPGEFYSKKYASETMTFVKGIDSSDPKGLHAVIYADESMSIYKKFNAKVNERQVTGKGLVTEFIPKFDYYIIKDGSKSTFRLNKKKILETLNNPAIDTYTKKNKLKLDNENDLKELMAYYRTISGKTSDPVASNF